MRYFGYEQLMNDFKIFVAAMNKLYEQICYIICGGMQQIADVLITKTISEIITDNNF